MQSSYIVTAHLETNIHNYWLHSNGVVYLWRGGELAAFTNAIKGGHTVVFAVDMSRALFTS